VARKGKKLGSVALLEKSFRRRDIMGFEKGESQEIWGQKKIEVANLQKKGSCKRPD